jgi:LAO/AO transport system kinase
VTTAATGEGVPELIAALARHRATLTDAGRETARMSRAEAQVWAIVADRLRDRLHEATLRDDTQRTLAEVAAHRLDPYTAADSLLASLAVDDHGAGRDRT